MTRAQTLKAFGLVLALGLVVTSWTGSHVDPRGSAQVASLVRSRESRAFKERLRKGVREDWAWPGLRSAQISWTWLELLQGLHVPESYEGDFSWMFSKLFTVAQYSDKKEIYFLTMLAPYYFVMGHDHAGATLFLDELFRRAPNSYNVWFWGGFHAVDNLFVRPMAAYCYEQAALKPGAPDYLAVLSQRLKFGASAFESTAERRRVLSGNISPEILERIERVRPKWFTN
jgi:hypothetical protein